MPNIPVGNQYNTWAAINNLQPPLCYSALLNSTELSPSWNQGSVSVRTEGGNWQPERNPNDTKRCPRIPCLVRRWVKVSVTQLNQTRPLWRTPFRRLYPLMTDPQAVEVLLICPMCSVTQNNAITHRINFWHDSNTSPVEFIKSKPPKSHWPWQFYNISHYYVHEGIIRVRCGSNSPGNCVATGADNG